MDYELLLLKLYPQWTVYLHEKQYFLGRCYVALNRPADDPYSDTTKEERDELELIILDLQTALKKLFNYDLLNYGNLRNGWRHCHWHVVPRYETARVFDTTTFTDSAWGRNWSHHKKDFEISEDTVFKIRDVIRSELS